ncbi:MAG: sigma 54-interacting transcriptional regulator [Bacteroidales bacterium]|nr:sigma 54-interacting transcriptional regulator [Bacteroidales bacterium]MBP3254747.1 sigma 54-interacting transcriptional regulator [Bacteroidales bacterium]
MADIQAIKQRFGIIGNDVQLMRAIEVAVEVAITDMSVLVTGESGVGKEVFSKIIHNYSPRKHGKYIAVNCGAIPEGTIESELFGHVKGAFTNADRDRKGYFAEADKGTIFLDEVGELPMNMQVKLLRVLESGEFLPVGSSKTLHCDVRVVAATNVNLINAIEKGTFREDLYYRLNQISISIPPLRKRKDDIYMLFKRFAVDQAEKYNMPHISLTPQAREYLKNYPWQGNVRQLKNVAEQISIIEKDRTIDTETLMRYIPPVSSLPMVVNNGFENVQTQDEALFAIMQNKKDIADLRNDVEQLKNVVATLINNRIPHATPLLIDNNGEINNSTYTPAHADIINADSYAGESKEQVIEMDESKAVMTLAEMEKQAIISSLKRHRGHRAQAAKELGISERTLYRKINDYNLDN